MTYGLDPAAGHGMHRGDYDVIGVGARVGGPTAASLLAKSGRAVLVVDRNHMSGGALGAFRCDEDCILRLG